MNPDTNKAMIEGYFAGGFFVVPNSLRYCLVSDSYCRSPPWPFHAGLRMTLRAASAGFCPRITARCIKIMGTLSQVIGRRPPDFLCGFVPVPA